jgi:hypothetical protein
MIQPYLISPHSLFTSIHLPVAGPGPLYSFKGRTAYLLTPIYSIVYSVPVLLSLSKKVFDLLIKFYSYSSHLHLLFFCALNGMELP